MRRRRIVKELRRALDEAFPDRGNLTRLVEEWIAVEPGVHGSGCALCGRALSSGDNRHGMVIEADSSGGLRCVACTGKHTSAVCPACVAAAIDAYAPAPVSGDPSFEMIRLQVERVLPLLDEEVAEAVHSWLARHPQRVTDGACLFCGGTDSRVGSAGRSRLCLACAKKASLALNSIGNVEPERGRCPSCHSSDVRAEALWIEFTRMHCDACGNDDVCDEYQLSSWYRA